MSQGRGRPVKFNATARKAVARLIKKFGMTGARAVMASEGVSLRPGTAKTVVEVSMPTLGKVASAEGVLLSRGRRKVTA